MEHALKALQELVEVKEPEWYRMGLILEKSDPGARASRFGEPISEKALHLTQLGFAAVEASKELAKAYPENVSRESAGFPEDIRAKILNHDCPLRNHPRCTAASLRYRTADGTCNNLQKPWRGAAMLPMQRFLPPTYEDGIQSIRRSVFGQRLPSAREISVRLHRDKDREIQTVSLMFMQWGQFIDHDVTDSMKSRSFNGSIPRCCARGGQELLPPELTHPACLPIEVPDDDWFLGQFGLRCLEFIRSAPSINIDCDLGWREQINQVTSYIDASTIYGSDIETSDSIRTFRNGKLIYPRNNNRVGELCRKGAVSQDCFPTGEGRVSEQPGLIAMHTIFIRYHNKVANTLAKLNRHWSDEKVFQEARKIIYGIVQHVTYREFLPVVLGQEVMQLFELNLLSKGYYQKYDARINPGIANSFGAAAFRFGHSMVQSSYVRADSKHRPIFNNVSLHEDQNNLDNIWTPGSVDRLLLGMCSQASQRRDEFMSDELTNHLFQSPGRPFGMDLAAINIQRGRDHGIPSYTSWRHPCGLSKIKEWKDLETVMLFESVQRLRTLYRHVDDVDLFSGGLAEKPVRGGVVGPTFACIIAQQFLILRKGDRFWYENGDFPSSLTPAQLQQIRRVSLAQILCQTLDEIETIQPFVFLSSDNFRNVRTSCLSPSINNFDLNAWIEKESVENEINEKLDFEFGDLESRAAPSKPKKKKLRQSTTTRRTTTAKKTRPTLKIAIRNITTNTVKIENKYDSTNVISAFNAIPQRPSFHSPYQQHEDVTYLVGLVNKAKVTTPVPPPNPVEVNIKIQYYPQTTTTTTKRPKKKRPNTTRRPTNVPYPIFMTNSNKVTQNNGYYSSNFRPDRPNGYDRPDIVTNQDSTFYYRPSTTINRPQNAYYQDVQYEHLPFSTSRPYILRPSTNYDLYDRDSTKYPSYLYTYNQKPDRNDQLDNLYGQILDNGQTFNKIPKKPTFGQDGGTFVTNERPNVIYTISKVEKLDVNDKLDFKTRYVYNQNKAGSYEVNENDEDESRFVKISSVKAGAFFNERNPEFYAVQSKEGELELLEGQNFAGGRIRVVDIEVSPSEFSDDNWLMYNATSEEEATPTFLVPDINNNISCSQEMPQQMNVSSMFRKTLTQD